MQLFRAAGLSEYRALLSNNHRNTQRRGRIIPINARYSKVHEYFLIRFLKEHLSFWVPICIAIFDILFHGILNGTFS